MRIGRFHGRRRIQHWAFNQLYRHDRWLYDPLAHIVFSGEWDRWRRVALPFVNGSPVLDLGCGTGALLPLLAGEGRFAVGLERSPSMLAAARKRWVRQTALIRGDALISRSPIIPSDRWSRPSQPRISSTTGRSMRSRGSSGRVAPSWSS
jgi:SAM-dependent methyltransferase